MWLAVSVAVLALAQIAPMAYLNLGILAAAAVMLSLPFPAVAMVGLALDLAQITAVALLGAENAAPPKQLKRYNYAQDLRPAQATVLSVSNEDGECEILFCPDEYMHRVLEEAVLKKDAAAEK